MSKEKKEKEEPFVNPIDKDKIAENPLENRSNS